VSDFGENVKPDWSGGKSVGKDGRCGRCADASALAVLMPDRPLVPDLLRRMMNDGLNCGALGVNRHGKPMRAMPLRSGFTLLEMLVVVILMGLAAALVAPALLAPRQDDSALKGPLESAREVAARRGEVVTLRIDPTGQWRMAAGVNPLEGTFATGRMQPFLTASVTLKVSPLGSCAFDLHTAAAASAVPLDPLTCEIRAP
jgi:prepilin-type N-terminal cleavage/methylation domain-containing protein